MENRRTKSQLHEIAKILYCQVWKDDGVPVDVRQDDRRSVEWGPVDRAHHLTTARPVEPAPFDRPVGCSTGQKNRSTAPCESVGWWLFGRLFKARLHYHFDAASFLPLFTIIFLF
uniref:Uncharacterized protein n=1 Tax=Oryza brachyantha TaxID=4533 RepID=J3N7C4_ORYBR